MGDIDETAPMVYFGMLITTVPEDQRPPQDDFGPYLRANANVIRRTGSGSGSDSGSGSGSGDDAGSSSSLAKSAADSA
eukprot:COSAG01_NODE_48945_length_376_cov_1.382671_1_plen_77_part_01